MAQAAVDEDFHRIARLVWARSGEINEMDVHRWMKSIDSLESSGALSEGVAYDLRSCGYLWRNQFDEALRCSRLALQRLPPNTKERANALTNFAAAAAAKGDPKAAVTACVEALGNPHTSKGHISGILVGELCALGLAEDASAVADEYLSDAALEKETPCLNPAIALAVLGRRHRAIEQLARYVTSVSSEARGDRSALDVLAAQRSRVTQMLAHMPPLVDAWRYVEAYEAARVAIDRDNAEHQGDDADGEIPDWVHAARARAAREVLPESEP